MSAAAAEAKATVDEAEQQAIMLAVRLREVGFDPDKIGAQLL